MERKGMTLVELLVALGIAGILLALILPTALGNRRLYTLDVQRTGVNQNLRAGLDFIVADVRQAGERLPVDFPAIEVQQSSSGSVLVIRRNLLDSVLTLCDRIDGNQDNIPVAVNTPGQLNQLPNDLRGVCAFRDTDRNRVDDRIDAFRAFRCSVDGNPQCSTGNNREAVRIYIYDPVSKQGEWFVYDAEDSSGVKIHKGNRERWTRGYSPGARIYALEERKYYRKGDLLVLEENGQTQAKGVVAGVTHFGVRAQANGGWYTTFPQGNLHWKAIETLELTLRIRSGNIQRELSTRAVPRNVFSQ
ncbi:MAG: prepilin-type N-terminal cleavage/methylation domain-containing protein [Thermus sp.]|nr:prepilin-type N-terminal cleavage/methylation domain-containing protein [Thermus sp.]